MGDAKSFDAYPIYYSGEEVAGLPLERVSGPRSNLKKADRMGERAVGWSFTYGDCTPPSGSDGGCAPPLQIQNWSTCFRSFGSIDRPRNRQLYDFRGAKATGGGGGGSPMEIFTGRTTVVIFANERSVAEAAARQLRNVHQDRPPSRLPPPVAGSLGEKLPCQRGVL